MRTGLKRGGPAALLAVLLLASCGGDSDESAKKVKPVGQMLAGSVAPTAQCRDWEGGNRDERLATIEDIREQINLKDSAVQTPERFGKNSSEQLELRFLAFFKIGRMSLRQNPHLKRKARGKRRDNQKFGIVGHDAGALAELLANDVAVDTAFFLQIVRPAPFDLCRHVGGDDRERD